ncbi:lysophospholipid acyltransferase family protein [Gordonia sp. SL306]|uniref:lysophospholipid acyltransferase family protein n=1 Tax=Gordonia sp. SL306 TaxID=2995145 RepID=UPI002271B3EB|nr:lysophospholipid acyltransferase family protein [Gordonia sp. SL306]WAC56076.1 lysophospholipid acyltransferase family protein [Gordonia sp. SL306]
MTAALAAPGLSQPRSATAPTPAPVVAPARPDTRHAWYPVSRCGDHCREQTPAVVNRVVVIVRMVRLMAVVCFLATFGPMVALAPRLLRRRFLSRAARHLLAALGVCVRIDDRRPFAGTSRGLVVANHISYLDILAVAVVSPSHFVAKSDVTTMPVISGLARRLGIIPVERASLRELPTTIRSAVDELHRDRSVAVFPEGTTWCGREAGRFRPAFFQAAIDAGVPVTPIRLVFTAMDGSPTSVPGFIGDDTPLDTLRRVLRARGLTVDIRVHESQLPDTDRRTLATRCERLVTS